MSHDLKKIANAIRILAADAVEAAQSGHPGMPLGMADVAVVLWATHLRFDPKTPDWLNRDRFVLSNGHGSMLLYALLYASGFDLSLDDIKQFRQLGSKTPGHPEYDLAIGVETTTGPLGQGLANAVGMALAERMMAARFNQGACKIVDYHTYVMVGDGCLMEGISHEVAAFAGRQSLGHLIVLWDDNDITIDGHVGMVSKEDVLKRFDAYGWHTVSVDGHDYEEIHTALIEAKTDQRPSLISCRTQIGYGSDLAGSPKSHGAPLGSDVIEKMRHQMGGSSGVFEVDETLFDDLKKLEERTQLRDNWDRVFEVYQQTYPQKAQALMDMIHGEVTAMTSLDDLKQDLATRVSSKHVLHSLMQQEWRLVGGSADLAGSNGLPNGHAIEPDAYDGSLIHFGVREFVMMAMCNGLALSGFKPFCATFLTFSDYGRNAIRMAAQMSLPVIYIMTHDSIGLGEDGPTHQPIEHLSSLRAIPNLDVWRPADDVETRVAWQQAILSTKRPHLLALSRQSCPHLGARHERLIMKGGYVLIEANGTVQVILMATGSEVSLALNVKTVIESQGFGVRVVSMPCHEVFLRQDKQYQGEVLSQDTLLVAIEAAEMMSWHRWVGSGLLFGCESFGHSAPRDQVYRAMGLTKEQIAAKILAELERRSVDAESCH